MAWDLQPPEDRQAYGAWDGMVGGAGVGWQLTLRLWAANNQYPISNIQYPIPRFFPRCRPRSVAVIWAADPAFLGLFRAGSHFFAGFSAGWEKIRGFALLRRGY